MKHLLHHPLLRRHFSQGMKFVCVGATGAFVDFSILNVLIHFTTLDPRVANLFSTLVSSTCVYLLNSSITFRKRSSKNAAEAGRFFMVYAFAYVMNVTLTSVFYTAGLHFFPEFSKVILSNISKALAIGIGMIWNYTLSHLFVFKRKHPDPAIGI